VRSSVSGRSINKLLVINDMAWVVLRLPPATRPANNNTTQAYGGVVRRDTPGPLALGNLRYLPTLPTVPYLLPFKGTYLGR
jgi:hypothetical protein